MHRYPLLQSLLACYALGVCGGSLQRTELD